MSQHRHLLYCLAGTGLVFSLEEYSAESTYVIKYLTKAKSYDEYTCTKEYIPQLVPLTRIRT